MSFPCSNDVLRGTSCLWFEPPPPLSLLSMNLKDIDIDVLSFFFSEFGYLREFIFGFMFDSQPTTTLLNLGLVCEIITKKKSAS